MFLRSEFLTIISFIGPMAGVLSACFGVGKVAFEKKDQDEVKAAIAELSNQINTISTKIDDSTTAILAHTEEQNFKIHVLNKVRQLTSKFNDYNENGHRDGEKKKLKDMCKINMPTSVLDTMFVMLESSSDNILKYNHYTEYALGSLREIYYGLFLELTAVHFICESLTDGERVESESQEYLNKLWQDKMVERTDKIINYFDVINQMRPANMWGTVENRLSHWYDKYRALENVTTIQKNYVKEISTKFNQDYRELGYKYTIGVIKYTKKMAKQLKKKKPGKFHFSCDEDACKYKIGTDIILWILRSKICHISNKNMATRAQTCLQFQMLLYSRFNEKQAFNIKDAKGITEMFKRNCKIKNLIGFLSYRTKLMGKSGVVEGGPQSANIYPDSKNRVAYNILTERKHLQFRWSNYDDMTFFADCENEYTEPFDFIHEYCTPESAWPKCYLTEKAFHYHRLGDGEHPYGPNSHIYHEYTDKWAKAKQMYTKIVKKILSYIH